MARKFGKALILAVLVTLAAQTIDIFVHLATNVTVHIPYISIKMTVIAFTIFLANYWLGFDWHTGIFATLAAVVMFYIYYRFTEPTLDRTIFTLDDDVVWIPIHFVAVYAPYLLLVKLLRYGNKA